MLFYFLSRRMLAAAALMAMMPIGLLGEAASSPRRLPFYNKKAPL
jgi:hypothetical protein